MWSAKFHVARAKNPKDIGQASRSHDSPPQPLSQPGAESRDTDSAEARHTPKKRKATDTRCVLHAAWQARRLEADTDAAWTFRLVEEAAQSRQWNWN